MPLPDGASAPEDLRLLIERASAGDPAARESLFARCREPLLERIRWMMGAEARRAAESGDFLQSAFAAALGALPEFELRDEDSFQRWLVTIARNKIRVAVRRRRERVITHLSAILAGSADPQGQDVELEVDAALSLYDAFARLPEEDRRLVELHDLEGRGFDELAGLLGCSMRHARRRHTEALLRLSRAFRDDGRGTTGESRRP